VSGHSVPYQLRTNKFVERQLFLDLLDFVRVWNGSARYVYASMGGRFLEDFKLMNDRFAIEHMISIEMDETTWKRQDFNRPVGFVECRNQRSGDFIVEFDRLVTSHTDKRFIVWLDYAAANHRGTQLQEYQELLAKLATGDIVKITLNANHQSFRRRHEFQHEKDFHAIVMKNVEEQLGEYMPSGGISKDHLKPPDFARLLAKAVKVAALKANEGSQLKIVPLAAFRYSDGEHSMLTVSAVLADSELIQRIDGDVVFQEWRFRSNDWDDVHHVNVPDLSPKERLTINELIAAGTDENTIHPRLPFQLASKESESLSLLASYLDHYRRYPTFGRIQ